MKNYLPPQLSKQRKKRTSNKGFLTQQDWLYHCYHLADNNPVMKDCKVCDWHDGLSDKTKYNLLPAAMLKEISNVKKENSKKFVEV